MINEPIRLDPPQPCVYCANPAIRAYNGEPVCTMCHNTHYLAQAERVRRSVPAFVERKGVPEWEPGRK